MKSIIKTAMASFGMSGKVFHGPFLKVNPSFYVKSILERTKSDSLILFPDSKIVRKFDDILNDAEIELVIINTPDAFHYEMASEALNAGKHIVVEKPVTLKSEQAIQLLKLAKEKEKVFTVFQNRRWDNDFLTVQRVITDGKLGRLIEFESHYDRYRVSVTPGTWKEDKGEFNGVLFNLGSHMVDQVYVLFGKPLAVTAHLKTVRAGGLVPDYYDIRLEYNTFSVILKCSYLVHTQGPRYIIHGEKGSFFKSGIDPQEELLKAGKLPLEKSWGKEPAKNWGTLYYSEKDENQKKKIKTETGNYQFFYNNLFDAIRNGTELRVKPEETIEVLKILETCIKSSLLKKTIEI